MRGGVKLVKKYITAHSQLFRHTAPQVNSSTSRVGWADTNKCIDKNEKLSVKMCVCVSTNTDTKDRKSSKI